MKKENILLLLTPKDQLAYIDDTTTLRQAIEKMRVHHYTSIPVINKKEGTYIASISEGDILWLIYKHQFSIKELEENKIINLIDLNKFSALKVTATLDDLLEIIVNQNYVPIVDDRNVLMGIITRKAVINKLKDKI